MERAVLEIATVKIEGKGSVLLRSRLPRSHIVERIGEPDQTRDMGTGYSWSDWLNSMLLLHRSRLSLCFLNDNLSYFSYSPHRDHDNNYWGADEKTFQKRLYTNRKLNDAILEKALGPPDSETEYMNKYNRGDLLITSCTDVRGGFAEINIKWI